MATDELISRVADLLWMGGLAASPLAILIGCVCRCRSLRPSTKHMLWFAVLASFVTPMLGALIWRPQWFRSEALIAAADSVLADSVASAPNAGLPGPRVDPTPLAANSALAANTAPVVTSGHPVSTSEGRPVGINTPLPLAPHRARVPVAMDRPRATGSALESVLSGHDDAAKLSESRSAASGDRANVDANPARWLLESSAEPASATLPSVAATGPLATSGHRSDPPRGVERPTPIVTDPSAAVTSGEPASVAVASGWADVRAWLIRLLGVRDAIAALPRVPGVVWVGGAMLLITISMVRTLLAGRWVQRATPADPSVQASVRQVGEALGLAKTPRAYFVDAAVSPMIWCGWKTRLILPERLWRTLDADARRAVLVHELAHVRRGDHLVCWVQAAIGAVYWWHPVVWWARKRLHDEAEASCDAWVTSLFPKHRRAYASALLVTTSYISLNQRQGGPWLGVVSKSAKRLARRITMVMTERSAPGKSVIGVCVASLVLTAGTFVMPGLACPPEKETKEIRVLTGTGQTAVVVPGQPAKSSARTTLKITGQATSPSKRAQAGQAAPGVTFLGEAPALEAMRDGVTVEGRAIAPVETTEPGSAGGTVYLTVPGRAMAPAKTASPQAPRAPRPPQPARAPKAPRAALSVPGVPLNTQGAVAVEGQPAVPAGFERYTVGRTAREYALAADKLDAFYCFMSRDDVPILVQRAEKGIIIWGTAEEHKVFEKFIGIVGGSSRAGAMAPSLDPLSAVQGEELALIEVQAAQSQRQGQAAREAAKQYRSMLGELERSREAFERDTERAREEAEAARDRAQTLREIAGDLDARAAELSEEERTELEVAAKRLYSRSETLSTEAQTLEARVAQLEQLLEQAEERAEALEERLDELDGDSTDPTDVDDAEAPMAPEEVEIIDVTDVAPPAEAVETVAVPASLPTPAPTPAVAPTAAPASVPSSVSPAAPTPAPQPPAAPSAPGR